MTAAEHYAAMVDAANAQLLRVRGAQPADVFGPIRARRFRQDPHRQSVGTLAALAAYVEPRDVVLDVGGGAGRYGLPLALRCREVINVDPSPAMKEEFEACAVAAGITNARFIQSGWLKADGIKGDLALVSGVTGRVRNIVPFIAKLRASARRRVLIRDPSVPYPNQPGDCFRLIHGEEHADVPGYRELLPVLWEMGVLPEVRVLPGPTQPVGIEDFRTRESTIERALQDLVPPAGHERARVVLREHFDEMFVATPERYAWRRGHDARDLLITFETVRG